MDGDLFKRVGIDLVLAAEEGAWKSRYMVLSTQWFRSLPAGTVFNGEAMRLNALREGIGHPHHVNCWGAIASAFLKPLLDDGELEYLGGSKAVSPQAHARFTRTYRKV